jgi:hypothetical protein
MTQAAAPLKAAALVVPKNGSTERECEDAVGVGRCRMRFCVADGATEAFDSRYWARLLTKCWSRGTDAGISPRQFEECLPVLGDRFHSRWEGKQLPWYSAEKSRGGAFAAFAGLAFESDGPNLRWTAAALGDSCLFQLADGGVLRGTIPDVTEIGSHCRPMLIPSRRALQADALRHLVFGSGEASRGDVFLLLTDSIAVWYARMLNVDPHLARAFDGMIEASCHAEAEDLIQRERRRGTLRNDDVAAVRVQFTHDSGASSVFGKSSV